jgi:hypothetical protein
LDFTVQKISNGSVMRLEDRGQPMAAGDPAVILSLVAELGKQSLFESWIESAGTLQGVHASGRAHVANNSWYTF